MKSKSKNLRSRLDYDALIAAIGRVHEQAQAGAAGVVNRHLVVRNWIIGAYVVEYEQHGRDRAAYGSLLLKRLATDLRQRRIGGTSPDMIERMRLFYITYPQIGRLISAPVVRKSCDGLPANELALFPPMTLPAGRFGISAPAVRKSHEK